MNERVETIAKSVRWLARILSGAIFLFWGWFMIASLVGEEGRSSRPLHLHDVGILVTLTAAIVGLAIAWRREVIGAAATLVAIGLCAILNWRVLVFPGTLIPLAALLFVSARWIGGMVSRETVSRAPGT
jgi:hypothetical protein